MYFGQTCRIALLSIHLLLSPSAMAGVIHVTVQGTFEDRLRQDNSGGLPYPFPGVLGGTFEGAFSIVPTATPRTNDRVAYYDVVDVEISILDSSGGIIEKIGDYDDDEFREFATFGNGRVYLGKYTGMTDLQDLRLRFDFDTDVFDSVLPFEDFKIAQPSSGFVDTDSQVHGGWNVGVADWSFQAEFVPTPVLRGQVESGGGAITVTNTGDAAATNWLGLDIKASGGLDVSELSPFSNTLLNTPTNVVVGNGGSPITLEPGASVDTGIIWDGTGGIEAFNVGSTWRDGTKHVSLPLLVPEPTGCLMICCGILPLLAFRAPRE